MFCLLIILKRRLTGEEAIVTFDATLQDNLLNRVTQTEKLRLRRVDTDFETHWEVFPGKPEEVIADESSGVLLRLATFMAYPQEMIELTGAKVSQETSADFLLDYLCWRRITMRNL